MGHWWIGVPGGNVYAGLAVVDVSIDDDFNAADLDDDINSVKIDVEGAEGDWEGEEELSKGE